MILSFLKKINRIEKILTDKKYIAYGDSITGTAYPEFVKTELNLLNLEKYYFGGYSIAYRAEGHLADSAIFSVFSYTKSQIISILAGTNDWQNNSILGAPSSIDDSEFNGAVNNMLQGIKSQNPTAFIFCIIPPQRWHYEDGEDGFELTNSVGLKLKDYNIALRERSVANNIPYLNLYDVESLPYSGIVQPPTTMAWSDDGIHPNEYGSEIIGKLIANYIEANYH